jgi:protein TonB
MFSFNSHEGGLADQNLTPLDDQADPMQKKRSFLTVLNGEERPRLMGGLLLILVLLLHLWAALWFLTPAERTKAPEMTIMEVSLIPAPAQPAPPVTPPAPPKPPEPPKKQVEKKPVKKKAPVPPKPVEQPQPIVEQKPSPPAPPAPVPPTPAVSRPAAPAVSNEPKISTGVVPLERIPPKYPARAADRHIEGWVKIEFTVAKDGTVKDAEVVESEPPEVFDDAALKAINQWTFREKIVNGEPVEQRAVQTLQFKLTR